MKPLFILFFFISQNCLAQMPLQSKEYKKTEIGFLYFWDLYHPIFVSIKGQTKTKLGYSDFSTDSLNIGLVLSWEGLNFSLKDMEKKGKKYEVYTNAKDSVKLTIIPVELRY